MKNGRLMSLDALRGFDMLWIMGGGPLVCAISSALGFGPGTFAFDQMQHAAWHGLRFMDTVFPLFLFIAGVTFPFSVAKRRAEGQTRRQIALAALRRGLTLVILGFVYENSLNFHFADCRVWSVLGRIGLAWTASAWLFLAWGWRVRLALAPILLLVSWGVTALFPAPGVAGADPFSAAGNLGCWLDRTLTAGHIYEPLFDPEGFAGLVPSVVTAMLGVFAGEWIRHDGVSGNGKALGLLLAAEACAVLAGAFSAVCPVNKALWTGSFVLAVGAYSFALLAIFYWLVDVKGWRGWTFPLRVVGMNSIAIYLAQTVIGFRQASAFLFGGVVGALPAAGREVGEAVAYLLTCWLFLYFLYRNKVFFKV